MNDKWRIVYNEAEIFLVVLENFTDNIVTSVDYEL